MLSKRYEVEFGYMYPWSTSSDTHQEVEIVMQNFAAIP